MRLLKRVSIVLCVSSLALGLTAGAASAASDHCGAKSRPCGPPVALEWKSPRAVFDGVPAMYRSIGRCPDKRPDGSPIQGVREVQITILFSTGGGVGDVAPVNRNGSWRFVHAFGFGGTVDRNATVEASCLDVTNTGFVIAEYRTHSISVNPARRHDAGV